MKRTLFFLAIFFLTINISFAQERTIARGAKAGELYLAHYWYGIYHGGPPFYDTLRTALYRVSENGKKLTVQYDADYFADTYTEPGSVMQPYYILADATSGVAYNVQHYSKNNYAHTALWVSFDFGENWVFKEENIGSIGYFNAGLYDSVIYKGGENRSVLQSRDYGNSFDFYFEVPIPYAIGECSYTECEFLGIGSFLNRQLHYTADCANSFTVIPIDEQYLFGQISGIFPDLYRGGKAGEVYVSSMFPDTSYYVNYKVSFSADTGHTFRHVFVSDSYDFMDRDFLPLFMSDREPGVFYIIRRYEVEDFNPRGWHTQICIEYYRDYGETWVDTYCHDVTKDYVNEVGVKEVKELEGVRVFPNPTAGELRIEVAGQARNDVVNVEVFDVYGRKLSHISNLISQISNLIDISEFPAGIYFVRITTEKGIITKKVIKM